RTSRCGKRNDQLVVLDGKLCGRLVHQNGFNVDSNRIKNQLSCIGFQDGQSMRNVAKDFLLFGIELEGDSRMLQVVVAAPGVRLVRSKSGNKEERRDGEAQHPTLQR